MELYLVVCVFAFIEIVVVYHSRESVVGSEDSKAGSCVAASWYTRLSSMRKSEWSRAGGVPTLTIAEKQCAIRVQNLSSEWMKGAYSELARLSSLAVIHYKAAGTQFTCG
ncbi:uncharacterized protein L203_105592 [Cryptococcus depauperatus CBS 7841]|uniref:Secreted protein n=1 Tax=Cryptococcus depauperatus CBS 7841 TaxID=1295531 RepID=A0AAJ8JXR6_9TREE